MQSTVLIAILLLPSLTLAQTNVPIEDVLAQLPAGVTMLEGDPLQTVGFHAKDESATAELVPAADEPGGHSYRVVVTRKTDNHWEIGMNWRPEGAINQDDVLIFAFRARSIAKGQSVPGEINVGFRRVEKPYSPALSTPQRIGGGWKQYVFPFSPDVSTGPRESLLIMNFGSREQAVEIADVRLISFGRKVSLKRVYDIAGISRAWGNFGKVAGRPLTPDALWDMDAFAQLPAPPEGFDPAGSWTHTYSIWTCHGYMYRGNKRLGYLKIAREAGAEPVLRFEQQIVNDDGIVHKVTATAWCRPDACSSLLRRQLTSEFISPLGEVVPELTSTESGSAPEAGAPLAADWCIFDAVQRLPFEPGARVAFDLLEGLSVHKSGHVLTYAGPWEAMIAGEPIRLQRFQQIGRGTLPYNYWLDEFHRLQIVVTHSRAYILDDDAETRYIEYLQAQQARFKRFQAANEEADGE